MQMPFGSPSRWVAFTAVASLVTVGAIAYGKVPTAPRRAPARGRPVVQLPTDVRTDFTAFVGRLLENPPRDPAGFFLTLEQERSGAGRRPVQVAEEPDPWGCNQDSRDRQSVSREQSFTYERGNDRWAYVATANWTFDDREDGRIRGTVRDQRGKLKAGARVTAKGIYRDRTKTATADRRGQFLLKLPSDFYAVTASAKDCAPAVRERVDACAFGTIASGAIRRTRAPGASFTLTLRCGEEFTVDQLSRRSVVPTIPGLGITQEGAGTFKLNGSRAAPAPSGPGWAGRWEVEVDLAVSYTVDIPSQNLTRAPLRMTACTAPAYRTEHRVRRRGTATFELPHDLRDGGGVAIRYQPSGPAEVAERELTAGVRCCNPAEPEACDPVRNESLMNEPVPQQTEEWHAVATIGADGLSLALPSLLFSHGNYQLTGDPIALRIRPKGSDGGALPPPARAGQPPAGTSPVPPISRSGSTSGRGALVVVLPADFPPDVPARSGGELTGAANDWASWLFTDVTPETIGDFYRAELPKNGWTIAGDGTGPTGGVMHVVKGDRFLQVTIGSDAFGLGKTQVTVRVTPR